jgi:hypothetical protein
MAFYLNKIPKFTIAMRYRSTVCFIVLLFAGAYPAMAQASANDTIRLGVTNEHGQDYPMVFLPEYVQAGTFIDAQQRIRRDKLRNDIYTVYPYAITAAAVLKQLGDSLENMDRRRDRRHFVKDVDRRLDQIFKDPLKNLSIEQGHVLIKLINRQTGRNCYSIIRELKGGISAVVWQSVGVLFNNNLRRDYDPEGNDMEMEAMVKTLEASNNYRYQLYMQDVLLKKIAKGKQ